MPSYAFFLESTQKPHDVRYPNRVERVLGKPAHIPAWPALRFFYREEAFGPDAGVVLTEAHTGCLVCKAPTRSVLQQAVARLTTNYSEAKLKAQIRKWPKCPAPGFSHLENAR